VLSGLKSTFVRDLNAELMTYRSWTTKPTVRLAYEELKIFKCRGLCEMPAPASPDNVALTTLVDVFVRGVVLTMKAVCPSMSKMFVVVDVPRKRTRRELD
jgi:hypothetical protein